MGFSRNRVLSRGFVAIYPGMLGFAGLCICFFPDESTNTVLSRSIAFVIGVVLIGVALYVAFGNAHVLKKWDDRVRLDDERREARRAQGLRGLIFGYASPQRVPSSDSSAMQIRALSDPTTARALDELQKLRYTRVISDEEFDAAKGRLLRSGVAEAQADAVAHLRKLDELHRAGVLNAAEFSAAKFKVLGL